MIASRRAPLGRAVRLPRPGRRALVALLAMALVLAGLYLGLRDSSLVAVQTVDITGVGGPDAGRIRQALRTAARTMTTLDVNMDQLRAAVAPYPVVERLDVSTAFPHGLTVHVFEQVPVATVLAGARRVAVSADGRLLPNATAPGSLPQITPGVPPGASRVSGGALGEVRLLAAAPYRILARVTGVQRSADHGLTAVLRDGPSVYFGSTGRLREKWGAAVAVLGDPSSGGAVYIDVTVPARPAAGAGTGTGAGAGTGTNATAGTGTTATAGTSTTSTAVPSTSG